MLTIMDTSATLDGEASLVARGDAQHLARVHHRWHIECHRSGILVWADDYDNIVVTAGLNRYLDASLKTGLAAPTISLGLITGPGGGNTYAAADVMSSHGGWTENTTYSNSTRVTWTPGTIASGSVSNSASVAVFNINGAIASLAGCFMCDNSTKGGTTGTLIGEGNFSGGDRVLQNLDTLSITVTATIS